MVLSLTAAWSVSVWTLQPCLLSVHPPHPNLLSVCPLQPCLLSVCPAQPLGVWTWVCSSCRWAWRPLCTSWNCVRLGPLDKSVCPSALQGAASPFNAGEGKAPLPENPRKAVKIGRARTLSKKESQIFFFQSLWIDQVTQFYCQREVGMDLSEIHHLLVVREDTAVFPSFFF